MLSLDPNEALLLHIAVGKRLINKAKANGDHTVVSREIHVWRKYVQEPPPPLVGNWIDLASCFVHWEISSPETDKLGRYGAC